MLLDDLRLFEVCHEIWKTSIVNLNVENAFVKVTELGMPSKKKVHMEGDLPYRGGGSTKSLVKFLKK